MNVELKILPGPRMVERRGGWFVVLKRLKINFWAGVPLETAESVGRRLESVLRVELERTNREATISIVRDDHLLEQQQGYRLEIGKNGIQIGCGEEVGLFAAVATLRQLIRQFGRRLPCLRIEDWPDFARRGVMLDVSRGKVPKIETLLQLTDHLADFKINEFQLYFEHTFAYRNYRGVWQGWGALTGAEIRRLDSHCRARGIDLVPNQNSFGHLREWLAQPGLRKLAEVAGPWEDASGSILRRPSTLAPRHPGTLPFLRGLYDELLPNFTSRFFNVGCDETWDLGRGQSKAICDRLGKGRVYLSFLKSIQREVEKRGKRMMFWGDIILKYPELARELPREVIALNWGYEAGHPFASEARTFARSRIPFYVCPGTSTWMSLIGRHDNAFANLREAAVAGRKHGAIGYLITDWGDGGHPQPLAVSYVPYLMGAALAWCNETADEQLLAPVLSRDIFEDPTGKAAEAAQGLGLAHQKLKLRVPNCTPIGSALAAPPASEREVFCHRGLEFYAQIRPGNLALARGEIARQRAVLKRARPESQQGRLLAAELDLAARLGEQSCDFMRWQRLVSAGRSREAAALAAAATKELRKLEREIAAGWRERNKGTPGHSAAFLKWRLADYQKSKKQKTESA